MISFPEFTRRFHRIHVWAMAMMIGATVLAREPDAVLPLWPGVPPGETRAQGAEHRVEGRPRPFYQLTDITNPVVQVFRAPADRRNGTALLVCPGGGMQRLAYEHEGLEVANWLNSLGLTACVLKYRVPSPARTAAMDAQRALGLVRSHAAEWGIDPESVGVMGFSAGGEIGAWLMAYQDERLYPALDDADRQSIRPDFAVLVYSGGLLQRDGSLKEPLAGRIRPGLPPVFLAHAFDDGSHESLTLALALKRAGVPTEMHLYREGGHGFGARRTGIPTGGWKDRLAEWLGGLGFLDRAPVREFARRVAASPAVPPRLTGAWPKATLADAYAIQRRLVRAREVKTDLVRGFRAEVERGEVLTGAIFSSEIELGRNPVKSDGKLQLSAGIGYVTSVDLSYEVLSDEQARGAVEAVVPVVRFGSKPDGSVGSDPRNRVAVNLGAARWMMGTPVKVESFHQQRCRVALRRGDQSIAEGSVAVADGSWSRLRSVLNTLTRRGQMIRAGSLIIIGPWVSAEAAGAGSFEATVEGLEPVRFELR